jgi:3-methyladenine DNA glycosylase/8-oxoguanine DNA glycosylase
MGELSDEALRSAGLSRPKVAALRDLAHKALAGELPSLAEARRLDDETLVTRLTRVRGIGRWSAEMFLIFRLGRPDVLPLDDYALLKGLALTLGRAQATRDDLDERGARWAPYRTVASWYLWQTLELSPT